MFKQKKAIIFDLDGTLVDSMHVWDKVDTDFLAKRGHAVPDDLFCNLPSGDGLLPIAHYFKERFSLTEDVDAILAEWESMLIGFYSQVKLIEGAYETLGKLLNSNKILGMGTSNSEVLAEAVLANNKIKDYFSSIVTGCKVERGKPFPDIYLTVAKELGVKPHECLVIEDTTHGVEAAKNAGMSVIAIYNDFSKKDEEALKQKSDRFVKDYNELDSLLF